MAAPQPTAVLGRRYVAFLIDAVLAMIAGAAVAIDRAEQFTITARDASGRPVFSDEINARLIELADFDIGGVSEIFGFELARAREVDDTLWVFGRESVGPGVLVALLAAFVMFALIPALVGRTVGMAITGLRIIDDEWQRPGVVPSLVRTLVGIVDAFPFVIPGALGFVVASRSAAHQRLGDRLATTFVIDRRAKPPHEGPTATETLLAAVESTTDHERQEAAAETADTTTVPERRDTDHESSGADTVSSPATPGPQRSRQFPVFGSGEVTPPPPMHRRSPDEAEGDGDGLDGDGLEPSPEAEGAGADEGSPIDSTAIDSTAIDSTAIAAIDIERAADELPPWDPPIAEPAPVWSPPLDLDTPASIEPAAPADAPAPTDMTATDAVDDPPAEIEEAEAAGSEPSPGADGPVWSEKWHSWLYWDGRSGRWLRHDSDADAWVPID